MALAEAMREVVNPRDAGEDPAVPAGEEGEGRNAPEEEEEKEKEDHAHVDHPNRCMKISSGRGRTGRTFGMCLGSVNPNK